MKCPEQRKVNISRIDIEKKIFEKQLYFQPRAKLSRFNI